MTSLLGALLYDLKGRSDRILRQFESVRSRLPKEVHAYAERMEGRARRLVERIDDLLNDPDLLHPSLARNFYYDYKRLAELTDQLESFPVLALTRFNDHDRGITVLVQAICREIGYPYDAPVGLAMSSQYYWAVPEMDLILVPSSEPFHLLALPDLYHEIAHFILAREKEALKQRLLDAVDERFTHMIDEGRRKNWPKGSLDDLEVARHLWKKSWYAEFAADMLATYAIGPAFGWGNVRVCTNLSSELYIGAETHPADEARTRGIHMVLMELGETDQAQEIKSRWDELVHLSGAPRPQEFDLLYPPQLLEDFTGITFSAAQSLGLQRWQASDSTGKRITGLLNVAWGSFMTNPDQFGDFEREHITVLRQEFGL